MLYMLYISLTKFIIICLYYKYMCIYYIIYIIMYTYIHNIYIIYIIYTHIYIIYP